MGVLGLYVSRRYILVSGEGKFWRGDHGEGWDTGTQHRTGSNIVGVDFQQDLSSK